MEYLDLAEADESLMALSVLHLALQHKLHSIDKNDLSDFADFLIHGPWMIDQLKNITRQKINTLRFVDEIEVYLAYPISLKKVWVCGLMLMICYILDVVG
ncbi:MAG: hypothetical protein FJZ57_07685 [Chlamydiae bacterium]|nr:hypothetical protein [Chlamydiota bacterium]